MLYCNEKQQRKWWEGTLRYAVEKVSTACAGRDARIAELEKMRSEDHAHAIDMAVEIDRLTRELEEARKDAERLYSNEQMQAYARAAIEADRAQRVPDAVHPMQPVVVARDKCHRFLENKMVNHLYEWARDRGMGLNEMAVMGFSDEDRMQFAQLIGYSVSGYRDLIYVSDASYEEAARRSTALLASTLGSKTA